jgi:hypothetical protein
LTNAVVFAPNANLGFKLDGATIAGATFTQLVGNKKINELQTLNLSRMKVLLTGAQLASTTTYERDDWRGVAINGKLDFTGFKFGNWKGARIIQYGGFEGADFTDAEIAGVFSGTWPRPKQVETLRTFKEGRIALAGRQTSDLTELQRRYALFKKGGVEALQAEDDALEAALNDKRVFYLYIKDPRDNVTSENAQVKPGRPFPWGIGGDVEARMIAFDFESARAVREARYLARKKDDGTFKRYCDEEKAKGATDAVAKAKAAERLQRELEPSEEQKVRNGFIENWKNSSLNGATISDVNGLRVEGSDRLVFGVPTPYYYLTRTINWREKSWKNVRFLGGFKPSDFEGWTLENCEFLESPNVNAEAAPSVE